MFSSSFPQALKKSLTRKTFLTPSMVHAIGTVKRARIKHSPHENKIDHVWLTVDAEVDIPIEISINTRSLRNEAMGFDNRVRVGFLTGKWKTLPPSGWAPWSHLDYFDTESRHNIFYEHYDRQEMEDLLLEDSQEAILVEVWGEPYWNQGPGIHQIHSRRASCAVSTDVVGKDGALKFYFQKDQSWRTILLKFCGQP